MGAWSRFAAVAAAPLILLVVCTSASAAKADKPGCDGDQRQPMAASADASAQALLCDMNELRIENGLPPLRWDWRLWQGAQNFATDMAARHYFSHVSPEGMDLFGRIQPTGYIPRTPNWMLSENLGFGTVGLSTPIAIAIGWMNSPPHRENLLDPEVEDVGIGLARGSVVDGDQTGWVYVADFGARGATPSTKRAAGKKARSRGSDASVKSRGRAGRTRRR